MWKVMVADDETYMLEAMEKLIDWKKLDCQLIYKAENGQELLEQIKNSTPDIVITDIKMPLMSGIQVAQYVYEHMLPVKIIILSAYAEFEYAQEAIEYDVCGYIVKTSVIEMLPGMIQKAIRKLSVPQEGEKGSGEYQIDNYSEFEKYGIAHIEASVPGNVELDLSKAGVLPEDLFMGNSLIEDVRKIETWEWWYKTEFLISHSLFFPL